MPRSELKTGVFELLERFTILIYSPGSDHTNVGKLWKELFTTENKRLDNLLLTRESLCQHTLFEQCTKVGTLRGNPCRRCLNYRWSQNGDGKRWRMFGNQNGQTSKIFGFTAGRLWNVGAQKVVHLEHAVAEMLNCIVHCFVIVKVNVLIHLNNNLMF